MASLSSPLITVYQKSTQRARIKLYH